ncbi:DUF4331 family protein [Psychroserpens algicola]|uniref:DUF4331 domain-containing protein n=1 Tax=Psychroserpens algicola TaxID=1719034 RepID=A0ABT0H6S6_9FLAO|nr:DUF4331 family protein [Psychroserpens algicola]MCK8479515.1 DUF4331 domain-containing protein [Psychroserpens algicola]
MKFNNIKLAAIALLVSFSAYNCSSDDDNGPTGPTGPNFTGIYAQEDQMGRPAINTVFVDMMDKNTFNTTIPSNQNAAFQSKFQAKLEALNPAHADPAYTNALGFNAEQFTGALATDVLTVSLTGTTTFFDGENVLTGRTLADDVISVELLLIFGGPMGTDNPGLTNDNVDGNDKPFSTSFPYLASPW